MLPVFLQLKNNPCRAIFCVFLVQKLFSQKLLTKTQAYIPVNYDNMTEAIIIIGLY